LHKSDVIITFVDATKNEALARKWGASGNNFPTAILLTFVNDNKIYVWNEETEHEYFSDTISRFITTSLSGTYNSYKISEPIPEKNDGPVKIIVGKNFEEIVYDNKKDVIVEFYAPWCVHCKKLAPIYDELGRIFKKEENLVIGKMDATLNAIPDAIDIPGYPTIYMFPAKNKKPILYTGNRDLSDMKKYLDEYLESKIEYIEKIDHEYLEKSKHHEKEEL